MKRFVELIGNVHKENFSKTIQKLVNKKIPVAVFSYSVTEQTFTFIRNLKNQGINISHLITLSTPPQKI